MVRLSTDGQLTSWHPRAPSQTCAVRSLSRSPPSHLLDLSTILSDMSNHAANEGFADPARIEFLQRYKAFLISTNTRGYEVPPVTWAMLWLAPLERLENDIDGLNTKFSELETSGLIALCKFRHFASSYR